MSTNKLSLERKGPVPIIALANRKGGSGKTTTGVTMAAIFAQAGLTVRLTDADPQHASASHWLPQLQRAQTLKEVFYGEATLFEATSKTSVENLYIVSSKDTLNQVERDRPWGSDSILRQAFQNDPFETDLEIIDCAGQMGVVTLSALGAATHLIIPLKMSGLDHAGQAELMLATKLVKERLNPSLEVLAVLLVDADLNTRLTGDLVSGLKEDWPDSLVMVVPHSVRAAEAPIAREPLNTFAPNNPVTHAYADFVKAIARKLGFEEK